MQADDAFLAGKLAHQKGRVVSQGNPGVNPDIMQHNFD